jgi:HSP20 family protein
MNLIPRRAELDLRRQVGKLFEDFLGDGWWGGDRTAEWGPAVDIAETPETVVIKAEVPGVNPKEIEVSVNENTLTLHGEKKDEKEEKGKNFHRIERSYGMFSRTITLPCPVDGTRTEAESKDGVLTITLPKQKTAIPKKIEVKAK